jgi:competence protein ComEC
LFYLCGDTAARYPYRFPAGDGVASVRQINSIVVCRPALPVAILFILGIASHPLLPLVPILGLLWIAMLLCLALVLRRRPVISTIAIATAIYSSGICAGQLAHYDYPANHIGAFSSDEPRLAWVEGTIADAPRLIEPPQGGRPLPDKQVLTLNVRAVRTVNGWIAATGSMPLTISPPAQGLAAGQVVRVIGRLERPAPAMNPGGFDAAEHYRRERVLAAMHVSRPYDVQILSNAPRLAMSLSAVRDSSRELLSRGFDVAHAQDFALLQALVFGQRDPEMRDIQEDFVHSGTTHLLAANGSRIALLAGAIYLLCRLLRLSPRRSVLALTILIALFGFLTLPAAEAIRPVAACVALGLGVCGRRAVDSLQVLCFVALAILVCRPLDLYGAGFQLSFTIVLGLILFAGPVSRWIDSLENADQKVADTFQRPTRLRRSVRSAKRWLLSAVAMGIIAWVVALPLVAYHFEQVNSWTVPFGLILSPFAIAALAGGFAKIALTAICPPLATTWAVLAAFPSTVLRHLVHWMATAPGCDIAFSRPSVALIGFYYALLLLPLVPWPSRKTKWCARCAPLSGCALLFLLPMCGGLAPIHGSSPSALRITLLSVGAGQCAVVEPTSGGTVVLDAGSSTITDPLRTCIEPFLRHEQCRSIDAIYLSHGDYDHISAADAMVPAYRVRQVLTSPFFRLHARESRPCETLLVDLDRSGHSPRLICSGDHFRLSNDVTLDVLWPPATGKYNSNNAGLVLRLVCRGRSILFPADIQEPAERELLKHPELLQADILVAPHHGSAEGTTPRFVAAVNPSVILASNDGRLTMKQRTFDAEEQAWPIYRTSRWGAITVEVTTDGQIRIQPFLKSR